MDSKEFFLRIGKAIYNIDNFYDEFARNSNVKANLLWILYALNDQKTHSQKDICKDWALPRSTVNTIIKEMEQDSYVELQQIKGKKRELNICLTQKGHELADKLLRDLYGYEREVYDKIKDKAQRLIDDLENFSNTLNQKYLDKED